MSGLLLGLMAAAMLAQADPAPATDAAAAQAPPASDAASSGNKAKPKPEKICVEEVATGSHFRRKICATREEWARRRAKDQETMTDTGGTPMR